MLSRVNKDVLANQEKEPNVITNIWTKKISRPIDIVI